MPRSSFGLLGQALDLADYVVGEEADGSSGEGWQARDARRACGPRCYGLRRFLPKGEDIPFQLARLVLLGNLNVPAARHQLAIGLNADKGIAAHIFAAFDRLEHEALRLIGGEAKECGYRRFDVCSQGSVKRHKRMGACKAQKFGASGKGLNFGSHVISMVNRGLRRGLEAPFGGFRRA